MFGTKYCPVVLSLTSFTQYRNPVIPVRFLQPPHNRFRDVDFQPTVLDFGFESLYDVSWANFPLRPVGSTELRHDKRLY